MSASHHSALTICLDIQCYIGLWLQGVDQWPSLSPWARKWLYFSILTSAFIYIISSPAWTKTFRLAAFVSRRILTYLLTCYDAPLHMPMMTCMAHTTLDVGLVIGRSAIRAVPRNNLGQKLTSSLVQWLSTLSQISCLTLQSTRQPLYTVFRKNTHSHFLSYLHELFVDLNKNCSDPRIDRFWQCKN